jgi:hypothetical protein
MSVQWRELAEQLQDIEEESYDLLELQIDRCLLAMARHLLEVDREKCPVKTRELSRSPNLMGDAQENGQ